MRKRYLQFLSSALVIPANGILNGWPCGICCVALRRTRVDSGKRFENTTFERNSFRRPGNEKVTYFVT